MQLDKNQKDKLKSAIYKKALGYKSEEVVKEFAKNSEGEMELIRQKKSTKHNSPDMSAAKMVLEWGALLDEYSSMTVEQLQQEKQKLIEIYNKIKSK